MRSISLFSGYGRGPWLVAVPIVITGVALLATAAFLVSSTYPGTRQIAMAVGVFRLWPRSTR